MRGRERGHVQTKRLDGSRLDLPIPSKTCHSEWMARFERELFRSISCYVGISRHFGLNRGCTICHVTMLSYLGYNCESVGVTTQYLQIFEYTLIVH